MDTQSAEFVDAVAAGLSGHPRRMQQMLGRVLRRPPAAIGTDPALLEGLLSVVATIRAPSATPAVGDDGGLSRWTGPEPVRGRRFAEQPPQFSNLPDCLILDVETAADPALGEEVRQDVSAIVAEHLSESLKSFGVTATRTVLMTGEPGTGKTMTARWIANQLRRPLLRLDLAAVMNKRLGVSAQNLVAAMDYASNMDAVLFIDEFDAIGSARASATDIGEIRRLVNVLLLALDNWPENHLLIGATNHPQLLDAAVHRRFEVMVRLPKPNQVARQQIWRSTLPMISDEAASTFATLSDQWSGSDIATCALRVRRKAALQNRIPNTEDVLEVLSRQDGLDVSHQAEVPAASAQRRHVDALISPMVGACDSPVRGR
ncbi:AAA family ATPase [Mycobacteroides abscessus]|nr:ATP-binding protein [Mycobacteroides abscessus]